MTRALVAALCAVVAGCTPIGPPAEGPPIELPTYAALATMQNERASRLQTLYARGTVEMTWRDLDDKQQHGQGSIDLWLQWPNCLAMQVTKLGEELFWLGCDETDRWLFVLTGDEKILYVGPHADGRTDSEVQDGQPLELSPTAWRDLLGLAPMPVSGDDPPPVSWDAELDAWLVEVPRSGGAAGRLRLFLDRESGLPRRIELRTDDELWAYSLHHHNRILSVEQAGTTVLEWPKIAVPIDLYQPDGSTVKVSLSQPTGIVDDQPFDRVCDLDRLLQAFRPDRIEGTLPE